MGGGLMQLVAYGAQDIYLTGNPQITFFKVVYRRHTNFSMEAIEQTLAGSAAASSTQTCTISRNGDLVHKVWIEDSSSSCVDGEIYDYIKRVDCEIGGQLIDRQTGDWNAVWWNLTTPESKVDGLRNTFVGLSGADVSHYFYYPLNFWFCRNVGLALPLIALQYHEVKLNITYGSGSVVSSPKVWIDYIYLDTDERRRFAQVSHEYLIEQVQRDTFQGDKTTFDLKFNHPVKELIFVNEVTSSSTESSCNFGPIFTTGDVVLSTETDGYNNADNTSMRLVLNGHDRFAKRTMKYFKTCQTLQHHTRCPAVGKRFTCVCPIPEAGILAVGANIFYVEKPVRVISATLTTTTATGDGSNTIRLTVDNGVGTTAGNPDETAITGLITLNAANARENFVMATTDVVCIQNDRHIGIESVGGDMAAAQGFVTLELEELPLLIGGDANDLGNIYCYSFALKPEEHQPSGTCNFSRIDSAQFIFDNAPGDSSTSLKVFAVNYNVLRIMSGMGGLAYSN